MALTKIVSGGQTGVDRAALDVALELGIPCGGWCPKGRLAEDGPISDRYTLKETPTSQYKARTEWNVRDSDATLILNIGSLEGGTALTQALARKHQRPCLIVELESEQDIEPVLDWLEDNLVLTLNIAGPRASKRPGLYKLSTKFLSLLLTQVVAKA